MSIDPDTSISVARVRETTTNLMATLEANSEQLQNLFQTPPIGQGQNDSMILGLILELQKGQFVLSELILTLGDRIERFEATATVAASLVSPRQPQSEAAGGRPTAGRAQDG